MAERAKCCARSDTCRVKDERSSLLYIFENTEVFYQGREDLISHHPLRFPIHPLTVSEKWKNPLQLTQKWDISWIRVLRCTRTGSETLRYLRENRLDITDVCWRFCVITDNY